jgi:ABC-type proline/glycine betaine transport system permease subunit
MDMILKILYMAATVLIHYEVLTFCLIGLVAWRAITSDTKTMIRSVIAFTISITILVGIPMGITEARLPKETKGDVEAVIMKEVSEWTQ